MIDRKKDRETDIWISWAVFLDAIASLQEGSKSESGMIIKTSLQGHRIYNIFNMSGMVIENITMVRRSGMIIKS